MNSVTESENIFMHWPKDRHGRFLCTKDNPMPSDRPINTRWRHDAAEETAADSDSYLEFQWPPIAASYLELKCQTDND